MFAEFAYITIKRKFVSSVQIKVLLVTLWIADVIVCVHI